MNVCMVAYTFYEEDARVRRYAEALASRGDRVDVVALRHNFLPAFETVNGVSIYRIQERVLNEKNKYSYLYRVLKFLVKSWLFVSRKHLAVQYDLVHVHSIPDFEVFAALLPKITGAGIILDIHDLVPEFYAAKFGVNQQSFSYRALEFIEKMCIRFSDRVIISNHLWEKRLISRSAPHGKCCTFLNYPDRLFFRSRAQEKSGKFVAIYPGSLNWHQGLDIAINAFAIARKELPEAEFHIYGAGPEKKALGALITELDMGKSVLLMDPLPLDRIVEKMAGASLGIVPKRNDPFGGEAFSTKVFEFMALGVPIVLSKTKIDSCYFKDSLVQFFEPEDCHELAKAIISLAHDKMRRKTLASNASNFVADFSWDKRKAEYFALVDELVKP